MSPQPTYQSDPTPQQWAIIEPVLKRALYRRKRNRRTSLIQTLSLVRRQMTSIFPANMVVNPVLFVNFQNRLAKTRRFLIAFAFG